MALNFGGYSYDLGNESGSQGFTPAAQATQLTGMQGQAVLDYLTKAAQKAGLPDFDFSDAVQKAAYQPSRANGWLPGAGPLQIANAILDSTGNPALAAQKVDPGSSAYQADTQFGLDQDARVTAAKNADTGWSDFTSFLPGALAVWGGIGGLGAGLGAAGLGAGLGTGAAAGTAAGTGAGLGGGLGGGGMAGFDAMDAMFANPAAAGVIGGLGGGAAVAAGAGGNSGITEASLAADGLGTPTALNSGAGLTGLPAVTNTAISGTMPGLNGVLSGLGGTGSAGASGASALAKILGGNGTAADFASLLGSAAPGLLGAYGANQQAGALSNLADKYFNVGAPSRARYEASMTPGFDPSTIPGYSGALDSASKAVMSRLSTQGNPYGNPGALIEANKAIVNGTALPAVQNYQSMNAAGGGLAALTGAVPGIAQQAIGSGTGGVGTGLGQAANAVFNPQSSTTLADLLKSLGGLSGFSGSSSPSLA